ncbi:hypothetical protein PIB30_028667 [Stylosanthes scabra]|uniref:Uncharacterized protein n=1 Tax=Stylosanthes scabra TaxID=79078 RepID=A0ABU6SB87_9FABA|nr:hypothetical protein [Stylosanthes scabra]
MPQHCNPCAPPVVATLVRIPELSVPDVEIEMGNSESELDYVASSRSSSDATGRPCYILPAPPPISRLVDVPYFFRQLHLDEGAIVDTLKAGMADDYNTNGGVELRVSHRMRNQEAIHAAVNNYSI